MGEATSKPSVLQKPFCQSSVYLKAFFNVLKNCRHLSVAFNINLLRAATLPFKLCTSLMLLGCSISKMARIMLGFASMHCYETMKPRNLPDKTLNAHLLRLSFML